MAAADGGGLIAQLSRWILGDASSEGLQPRVTTYEELHAEAQSILIPPTLPKGVGLHVLQPLSKTWALTHRVLLESGKPGANPFAALMGGGGGGGEEKDEFGRPKFYRHYALGAVSTRTLEDGGKLRVSTSLDNDAVSASSAMFDARGDGRLRVNAQAVHRRVDGRTNWGVTATTRGADYAAALRAKDGPEAGVSYHQRLAPGSPLTLGGEMLLSLPALRGAVGGAGGGGGKSVEWSVGAAYDAGASKTGLHLDFTGSRSHTLSAQHLFRLNERCGLAAKAIVDTRSLNSMVAAGYRLRFRNTATTVSGQVDTYGNVRTVLEREVVRDVRVAFSGEARLLDGGGGADNAFGLRITIGQQAALPRNLSPITMPRDVFGPY